MKATGIVRRIDELGRIVIPKEIRRTFRIKEGTPLEIFIDENDELLLKKFSPIIKIKDFSSEVCKSINEVLDCVVIIVDNDSVVSVCGALKKQFENKKITVKLEMLLSGRNSTIKNGKDVVMVCDENVQEFKSQIILPIVANGDVVGGIVLLNKQTEFCLADLKIVKTMGKFLEKQIS